MRLWDIKQAWWHNILYKFQELIIKKRKLSIVDVITFRFLISLIITENLQMLLMYVVIAYLYESLNNDIYMKVSEELKMSDAFKSKS
jgi:hypothetical protein